MTSPTLSGVRIREEIEKLGYAGSKTILDDHLRETRPRFLPPPRSFQRTVYRLGELVQFDLCEPRSEIPVGFGQTCRGYIVTCELPYSRAFARPADLARTRARERGGNFVRAREPGDWPRAAVQSS